MTACKSVNVSVLSFDPEVNSDSVFNHTGHTIACFFFEDQPKLLKTIKNLILCSYRKSLVARTYTIIKTGEDRGGGGIRQLQKALKFYDFSGELCIAREWPKLPYTPRFGEKKSSSS